MLTAISKTYILFSIIIQKEDKMLMKNAKIFNNSDEEEKEYIITLLNYLYKENYKLLPTVNTISRDTELSNSTIRFLRRRMIELKIIEYNDGNKKTRIIASKDKALKLMGIDNDNKSYTFKNERMYNNSKDMLQIWPLVIQEVRKKGYINLWQQLKGSNAIVKDSDIVEIIIYNPKPIHIDILHKQSHVDIIESEISKELKKRTYINYNFIYDKIAKTDNVSHSIYSTMDYGKFNILDWNRDINRKHVEELKLSIDKGEYINPILVNKNYEILDGQHRFIAKKELGLPIQYIIETNDDDHRDAIKTLNSKSLSWKISDYVDAYAKDGNENYQMILELKKSYPKLKYNTVYFNLFSASQKSIVNGKIKISDFEKVKEIASKLQDFEFCPLFPNSRLLRALTSCIKTDGYEHKQMIHKFKKYPTKVINCVGIEDWKKMLTDLYNYKSRSTTLVNFI